MIEMVLLKKFSLGGKNYSGLCCDISPSTLNDVLSLSYGEEMIYSFVIRKKDSDFVIRNEDEEHESYYERISDMYQDYEHMTSEKYIDDLKLAMNANAEYENVFMIHNERRIMFARPFSYSDRYLV